MNEGKINIIISILAILVSVFGGAFYYLLDQSNARKDKEDLYKKEITQTLSQIEKQISNLESLHKRELQEYKESSNKRFYEYREQTNVTLQEIKGDIIFLRNNHFFITKKVNDLEHE